MIFLILFVITLLPLKGLIGPGMIDAHDSISHVVRVASFYQSLTEGNLVPRWSQTLNYGYGHPIFMFLYPLPSYLASLGHFLGLSYINSIKLVLSLGFALAGLFAYLWFKELWGKTWPAVIGAAVGQLAPYRLVNLYVRNAFGENTATLFIPLVFWRFTKLLRQPSRTNLIWSALSLAGLLLSHNAISLMILPILCFYALLLLSKSRLYAISYTLLAGLLGFGLSAFFWFPALIEGKYTLRDIVTAGDSFADGFVYPKQLVIPSWGYGVSIRGPNDDMSFQVGLIQWLVVLATPLLFFKHLGGVHSATSEVRLRRLTLLFLLGFGLSILMMLPISSPIWQTVKIVQKFQFPWRFLTLTVVTSSFLAASLGYYFKATKSAALIIVGLLVLQTFWYWRPKGFLPQTEAELIRSYVGTTDTGESSPLWSVRFQEKPSPGGLSVVWGAPIDYQVLRRESELHEYVVTARVDTQISDNTLYFPGWTVYVDGQKRPITFADPNWRGEITFKVPPGTHEVKVVFEETKLRRFANSLSLTSLAALLTTLFL